MFTKVKKKSIIMDEKRILLPRKIVEKSFYFGMSINPFQCLFVVLEFAWKSKKPKHTRIIFNGRKKRLDSNKIYI